MEHQEEHQKRLGGGHTVAVKLLTFVLTAALLLLLSGRTAP